MQVDSTVLFEQGEDDTKRQEALRQFGRSLPNAQLYERHADAILSILRTRIERHANGCWSWRGEPYAIIGEKRMKLEPRLLVWVACAAEQSSHSFALWPICDLKECIRPEHQLEVVPFTTTTVELYFQIDELNEGIVKAAHHQGHLRRVESPHYPRAFAIRRDEWERWLHRPDFEEYLLELLPFVPLEWQPETYQRRRCAIRGEDDEQIDRMLLFSHHMGLPNVNRDTAIRSLVAFWNQIRVRNNAKFHGCWQWVGGNGSPLFVDGQEEPHILVSPDALGWALGTGALPSPPPGQIMHSCGLPHCVNPAHGSEVVLESDISLLFPPGLDAEILRLGVAHFEQARKRGTIQSSHWQDKGWAVTLAEGLAWMRTEGEPYVHSLLEQGARSHFRTPQHGFEGRNMSYIPSEHQSPSEENAGEGAELTFIIETHLANAHPGVILVRELRKGAKRFLKHSYVFLYHLDRGKETLGETLARLIYDDQIENRQGKYKGPRWDFQHATQLHLIQVIERPDPSFGQTGKPIKRDVGTAHIPGNLNAPAIIVRIAQVIDQGLLPPPDEAYLAPETPNAETSTAPSTGGEHRFPLVLQCTYNNRTLTGPLVFIATEEDGVSIDQCAILLPGEHDLHASSGWYHLFTFEDTGEALFLCDQGVHALTEPILLPRGDDDPPHYWLHEQVRIPVDGGKRAALSRMRNALANSAACFAEALSSYSIFCSACRQEYRPAINAPVLQEAARRGYVTTLCAHTFWCPTCGKWSTPTERTAHLATGEVCVHPRPTGWESKLTYDSQVIPAPSPQSAHALPSSDKQPPLHPYYEDALQDQPQLDGMLYPPRHPGPHLPASTGEFHAELQPGEQERRVLATFLEDCRYTKTGGESDFVPKGTRLIGVWDSDQPADPEVMAVVVNNVTWNLTRNQVRLVPLEGQLSQEQIAGEDEREAARREKLEDHAGAQAFYARAIIEYEASGWTEVRRASLRMNRAGMLLLLKQDAEAVSELDRTARAFEAQAYHSLNRTMGIHLDYAEHAVDALIPLATVYLHRTHDLTQARKVLERLLSLNTLIKKRYERKVDLLLSIAEFFLELGEQQEALTYFEQANRFYAQQLAAIADFSYVVPITKHLKAVKERLSTVKQSRTVRFTVTAKTPDDLEAVLEQLRKGILPRVEVTKGVTAQRTSKDARSGLVYVANLRMTLDDEGTPAK